MCPFRSKLRRPPCLGEGGHSSTQIPLLKWLLPLFFFLFRKGGQTGYNENIWVNFAFAGLGLLTKYNAGSGKTPLQS